MKQLVRILISFSPLLLMQETFPTQIDAKIRYNLVDGLPDIYISPMSERIGSTWSNGTIWDKPLIRVFYSLLATYINEQNNAPVVIDAGAQTGSFSLLAKYFPNSRWYSFEPIQEAADTLKQNLLLNEIANVSVYQMGISDFSGYVRLKMPPMNAWGLATLGGGQKLRFEPVAEREISVIDLDSFIDTNEIKKVNFMKLDTEGSELAILRGAKKMIMRDHPIILMEYNHENMRQCNVSKQEIDDLLRELGYEWVLVSHEDILCTPRRP